jgi:hypothetical protein
VVGPARAQATVVVACTPNVLVLDFVCHISRLWLLMETLLAVALLFWVCWNCVTELVETVPDWVGCQLGMKCSMESPARQCLM